MDKFQNILEQQKQDKEMNGERRYLHRKETMGSASPKHLRILWFCPFNIQPGFRRGWFILFCLTWEKLLLKTNGTQISKNSQGFLWIKEVRFSRKDMKLLKLQWLGLDDFNRRIDKYTDGEKKKSQKQVGTETGHLFLARGSMWIYSEHMLLGRARWWQSNMWGQWALISEYLQGSKKPFSLSIACTITNSLWT